MPLNTCEVPLERVHSTLSVGNSQVPPRIFSGGGGGGVIHVRLLKRSVVHIAVFDLIITEVMYTPSFDGVEPIAVVQNLIRSVEHHKFDNSKFSISSGFPVRPRFCFQI